MTNIVGAPLRILIVEDDPLVRSTTEAMLQRLGHTVLIADSAEAALAICNGANQPVDLVITDVMMEGLNGKELKDRLLGRRPALKVLFTSGHPFQTVTQDFALDPHEHFIQKPFSLKDLDEKILIVLRG